jgi:hypothetical protein
MNGVGQQSHTFFYLLKANLLRNLPFKTNLLGEINKYFLKKFME